MKHVSETLASRHVAKGEPSVRWAWPIVRERCGSSQSSFLREVGMRMAINTRTMLTAFIILVDARGVCLAQTHAHQHAEQVLSFHRELAKVYMKGELLEGFNKALIHRSPQQEADRIRGDAQAVTQCDAVLQELLPSFEKLSRELRQEYKRLAAVNHELRVEHARLRTLPKWAERYRLAASYQSKLARYHADYEVYLAKSEARRALLFGMQFCVHVIWKRDAALGARRARELRTLVAEW
jgi:hypothetical protein